MTYRMLVLVGLLASIACGPPAPQDFSMLDAETDSEFDDMILKPFYRGAWMWGDDPSCEMDWEVGPRWFYFDVDTDTVASGPSQTTWHGDITFERPHSDPSECLGYLDVQYLYTAIAHGNRIEEWYSDVPNVVSFDLLFRVDGGEATGEICGRVRTDCGGGRRFASFRAFATEEGSNGD